MSRTTKKAVSRAAAHAVMRAPSASRVPVGSLRRLVDIGVRLDALPGVNELQ